MPALPADQFPKYMRVLDYLRQGYLPTRACRMAETSWSTFKRAVESTPELAAMFEEALLECRDQLLEVLVEIDAADPSRPYGSADARMAKVVSDNIKWVLEKMWPDKFGTKIKVETTRADEAIVTALNEAIKRIPIPGPGDGAVVIEGELLPAALPYSPAAPLIDVTPVRDLTLADVL